MPDPLTVNVGLAVPLRGSNVGVWDTPVNADFGAIDGLFGGIVTVAVAATPVTLTSPSGFTPTPGAGPVQSQNSVIKFSGTLTAAVTVTLPTPGTFVLENLATGAFVLSFRAIGSGEVIAIPQGVRARVYCDGTNVRFVEGIEGRPGKMEFEGGEIGLPAWIAACTVRPYLLADGSVYNFSGYPALAAKYLGKFGGNGVTTFGVPDMRGRVPIAYDGTGVRITTAGCNINGQTMGASGGTQGVTLVAADIPAHDHGGATGNTQPTVTPSGAKVGTSTLAITTAPGFATVGTISDLSIQNHSHTISSYGGGGAHFNVQPSIVAGVWLIKT